MALTMQNVLVFQAISVTQAGKPEEKLELAFRLYDIDRNGTIEESEMQEIIRVRDHFASRSHRTRSTFKINK